MLERSSGRSNDDVIAISNIACHNGLNGAALIGRSLARCDGVAYMRARCHMDPTTKLDQSPGEMPPSTDPPQNPPVGEEPPWGTEFDPARAWATIQKLRGIEDEYNTLKRQQADAEKAQKLAADEALAEQQRFEELAENRLAEIESLRPEAERATRYEAALQRYLDVEREGLPAHILKLLDQMAVDEQLAYIAENREALKGSGSENRHAIPRTPNGSAAPATSTDIRNRYLKQAGVEPQ